MGDREDSLIFGNKPKSYNKDYFYNQSAEIWLLCIMDKAEMWVLIYPHWLSHLWTMASPHPVCKQVKVAKMRVNYGLTLIHRLVIKITIQI